jgi:DNA-binding LacI/PurR family transcriptional regulator
MTGIKLLARHLDLSIGTVSRALNGKPDVNPETRKRVLEAAASLGYVPNQSGRSLRQGTSNAIGFVIELSEETNAASEDFFMGVFDGVQSVFLRHKLDLVVFPCSTKSNPVDYLQRIVARGLVDALILSATRLKDRRIEFLKKTGTRFLTLGRSVAHPDTRWIDLDFESVAIKSVDRLVAHGHKRIAAIIPEDDINFANVFCEGFIETLGRHGLPYDPSLIIRHSPMLNSGDTLASKILTLAERPTAVVMLSEWIASSLYQGLKNRGVVPGKDIAIIGFRQSPRSSYLTPSLTSFSFPLFNLGQSIAETLLAGMPAYAQYYPGQDHNKLFPMDLVAGMSDDFTVLPPHRETS